MQGLGRIDVVQQVKCDSVPDAATAKDHTLHDVDLTDCPPEFSGYHRRVDYGNGRLGKLELECRRDGAGHVLFRPFAIENRVPEGFLLIPNHASATGKMTGF